MPRPSPLTTAGKLSLFLLGFIVLTAIPAGLALITRPDGSLLGLPLQLLQGTPFGSFLIPGAVLALVVGGGCLAAMALVAADSKWAPAAVLGAGLLVGGWIVGQVLFIGYQGFLQPLILAIALGLCLVSVRMPQRRRPTP